MFVSFYSLTAGIKLDLDVNLDKYDEFNPLILSSSKEKNKVKKNLEIVAQKKKKVVLSKKKTKKLKKILERKNKIKEVYVVIVRIQFSPNFILSHIAESLNFETT